MRVEADSAGAEQIPDGRLWGPQTARALRLFPSGPRLPSPVVRTFGLHKMAAAEANLKLGRISPENAQAIIDAAREVAAGHHDDQFPLSVWQTGSGTQTNMTANEVIANIANLKRGSALGSRAPIHPNDHVNLGQSSNDSFPTVMQVAALQSVEADLFPYIDTLVAALDRRQQEWSGITRLARTHLNDAVPIDFSHNVEAWRVGVLEARARIAAAADALRALPQGGTAAGTGLNTPIEFAPAFCEAISALCGSSFRPAEVKLLGMAGHDALVAFSGQLVGLALVLKRIADDIRHLGSGPRSGLGEILLADDGLSSSIMPGKRNATECETVVQAHAWVTGCDTCVRSAASTSLFELNVAKPILIHSLLNASEALSGAVKTMTHVVGFMEPDRSRMLGNVENSLILATVLTPRLGYEAVARAVRDAHATGSTLRDTVVRSGLMSAEEFDKLVDPRKLAKGGLQ